MNSILTSIKKMLGIEDTYEHFDIDIIIHINSALTVLNQIGIGPEQGYCITSKAETWDDYLTDLQYVEAVKTYVYLKVRLVFDPPQNSFLVDAMERQIREYEWRLNVIAEGGNNIEN